MRFYQRGFLFIVSGANGVGKTLFTIKEVHELAQRESRPVAYNGRFALNEEGPLKYWKKIDIKNWQAEPDGTIFLVDEAQMDFPNRGKGEVPPYVSALTEHRLRGFDFFFITQHPMNMDIYVRRLIGAPGWHRHLKRTFGANLVSQLQWASVNATCEKPGAGESGVVTMRPFPKEVYTWYKSAELHTGKMKIPKPVFFLLGAVVLIPAFAYFAWGQISKPRDIAAKVLGESRAAAAGAAAAPLRAVVAANAVVTTADYLQARTPRLEGFSHTAPAYDAVTAPSVAPYPAACVVGFNRRLMKHGCHCYTQQGTALLVPLATCKQIAENGFFVDWAQSRPESGQVRPVSFSPPAAAGPAASPSVAPALGNFTPLTSPAVAPPVVPSASALADGAAIGALRAGERRW